jgi:D-beta-D-heptose 7-phosphate kinase/D-beta-D-heptose 1-phosphate adenosyltransferase
MALGLDYYGLKKRVEEAGDQPMPLRLVLAIKPDVVVKGSDYAKADIAGAAEVESW